jgi:hypothetical protein
MKEGQLVTMTLHLNTSSGAERIDEDTREGEIIDRLWLECWQIT